MDWPKHPCAKCGAPCSRGARVCWACHANSVCGDFDLLERFAQKVHIAAEPAGCWWWEGVVGSTGYGEFKYDRQLWATHRLSWTMFIGPIPDDLWVLHHCDNRACVNPKHLWLGTPADNMADMARKNRKVVRIGEDSHFAKLSESEVLEIRALHHLGLSSSELAAKFNVCSSCVRHIVLRNSWKHLP